MMCTGDCAAHVNNAARTELSINDTRKSSSASKIDTSVLQTIDCVVYSTGVSFFEEHHACGWSPF